MSLVNFKGGKELQAMLSSLPAKLEANIMRSALRAGAKVIADEAKVQVPVDAGDLKRSIKVKTNRRRGKVTATVKAGDKTAYYAHMIEFGAKAHKIVAGKGSVLNVDGSNPVSVINHPGVRPKPFMRPAIDSKTGEAVIAVGEQVRKRLNKEGLNAGSALEIDE